MGRLKRTMGVNNSLELEEITSRHRIILISLGGLSASMSGQKDDFQELAKRLYFPPHWPPNRYLFTDDEERLFVMTYERGEDERKYMYDIFNAEGAFIGRMSLGNIQVIYIENERYHDEPKKVLVKGDILYCIKEKESGYIELVVYKMHWEQ